MVCRIQPGTFITRIVQNDVTRSTNHPLIRAWRFFMRHQVIVLLLPVIVGAAIAELVLHQRPLPPSVRELIWVQAMDPEVHEAVGDPRLLMKLKAGAQHIYQAPEQPPRTVTVNSLGFRGPERTRAKGDHVFRIIVFGSSTAYGAAVSDEQTLSAHLERILNERGDEMNYEVWNGGVSAYNPSQMAVLAEHVLREDVTPDVVLFHIGLIGARAFLVGHVDLRQFMADPEMLGEYFVMPAFIPLRATAWLSAHSRLFLMTLAHATRMFGAEERERRLREVALAHHRTALGSFVRTHRDDLRLAAFVAPCYAQDDTAYWVRQVTDPAGLAQWCIAADFDEPAYRLEHPPGYVYAHLAAKLAEQLDRQGFLAQ